MSAFEKYYSLYRNSEIRMLYKMFYLHVLECIMSFKFQIEQHAAVK